MSPSPGSGDAARLSLEALCERQRLDVIGELTGGLAHELNNAMSVLWGNAELLRDALEESGPAAATEELRRHASTMHSWSAASLSVSRRLYTFSKRLREAPGPVDANDLVSEAVELCRYRCERQGVLLIADLHSAPAKVDVHGGQVQQAIVNLILNGRDALVRAGEEGTVRTAVEVLDGTVAVSVEDDGPGIEAGSEERIFESGVSMSERAGAGLGLPVARHIAEAHGGSLRTVAGEGGHFVLRLPLEA